MSGWLGTSNFVDIAMEEKHGQEMNRSLNEDGDLAHQSVVGNSAEIHHDADEGLTSDDEDDSDIPTKSPPSPDPMAGIGYWESPGNSPKLSRKLYPQLCKSVQTAIVAFKEEILSKRHKFPTGILMDAVEKELPGTNEDAIKSEIEVQVLDLLLQNVNIDPQLQSNLIGTKAGNDVSYPNVGDEAEDRSFMGDEPSITPRMSAQMAGALNDKIVAQSIKHREMKSGGSDKSSVQAEVDVLLALKAEYKGMYEGRFSYDWDGSVS